MRRIIACFAVVLILSVAGLSACKNGSADVTYKNGVYVGKSGEDDRGAYGEVTITIESGAVADCVFVTWQKDGSIKDEDYGKVNGEISNQDYYDKAQLAVAAMADYARQFVAAQELADVDAIAGATIAFGQFEEAVIDALDEAKE